MKTKRCGKCKRRRLITNFYRHNHHADGLSSHCKDCTKKDNNERYHGGYKDCPEYKAKKAEISARWYYANWDELQQDRKERHRREREICIEHYGGKCACCGETRYEFLAIDHADGGGLKHRKVTGCHKIARWLVKNKFPCDPVFRILCHNCNMAIGFYGRCPHEDEKK